LDRAEQETRQALELDHSNQTTLQVLHQILHAREALAQAEAQTLLQAQAQAPAQR
jgi:hypothetical protein